MNYCISCKSCASASLSGYFFEKTAFLDFDRLVVRIVTADAFHIDILILIFSEIIFLCAGHETDQIGMISG